MITILFGAGASIPFYNPPLTTNYLTEKVLDLHSWEKVIAEYKEYTHQVYNAPSASVILELLFRIKSLWERNGKKINFEQLAEIIDKISSIEYDFAPDSNMLNLLLHTINANPLNLTNWKYIPILYREVIANAICDIYNSTDANQCKKQRKENLRKKQRDFITYIKSKNSSVSLVSLNYDDCLHKSIKVIKEFHGDCFEYEEHASNVELNIKNFLTKPYVVYYPHGHLQFTFDGDNNLYPYGDDIPAKEERWEHLSQWGWKDFINSTNFSYDFNTFITTGQTKDNAFNKYPFDIYYQRLAKDFIESNTIIIIGYSFGDEHINRLFKNFLLRDETNKAYIIDKYDGEVTMINERCDETNIIVTLQRYFGATFGVSWDFFAEKKVPYDSVLKKSNQEEIDKVNERGYGNIFNQVVFYKKGYEDFLNEYESVLTNTGNTKKEGCLPKILKCIL